MRGVCAALALCAVFAVQAYGQAGDFSAWLQADPQNPQDVRVFEAFLHKEGVADVLASDQLLLNATSWQHCKLDWRYSMPPRVLWPHIVTTIRFIRDKIVPAIGPVTVESGYREPKLNRCAGGAPKSAHALYYALDLVPLRAISRPELIRLVCKLHREEGRRYDLGLGFYDGVRFHIDTMRFRLWGSDNHGATSPCLKAFGT